jgi:hypothetical protein
MLQGKVPANAFAIVEPAMLGTSEIRQTLRRRATAWHGEAGEHARTAEHETTVAKAQDPVVAIAHFTKRASYSWSCRGR